MNYPRVSTTSTHLNWINSPNSAGRLLNLLLDRSNVRKLVNWPMSAGSLNRLLSLTYSAVRCSNCHRVGLTLRTLPTHPDEKYWISIIMGRPKACFVLEIHTCYLDGSPICFAASSYIFRWHEDLLPSLAATFISVFVTRHFINTSCIWPNQYRKWEKRCVFHSIEFDFEIEKQNVQMKRSS